MSIRVRPSGLCGEVIVSDRGCFDSIGAVKLLIVSHSEGVCGSGCGKGSTASCNVEAFPVVIGGGLVLIIAW